MNGNDRYKKTVLPEENEAAEPDIKQLEKVADGNRDGKHGLPTDPETK